MKRTIKLIEKYLICAKNNKRSYEKLLNEYDYMVEKHMVSIHEGKDKLRRLIEKENNIINEYKKVIEILNKKKAVIKNKEIRFTA